MTYFFGESKDAVIYQEANLIFTWAIVNNVHPFIVFITIFIVVFITTVFFINVLSHSGKKYGAYQLYIITTIFLCVLRPLAGLSWYYTSDIYSSLIAKSFQVCMFMLPAVILLYIIEEIINHSSKKRES